MKTAWIALLAAAAAFSASAADGAAKAEVPAPARADRRMMRDARRPPQRKPGMRRGGERAAAPEGPRAGMAPRNGIVRMPFGKTADGREAHLFRLMGGGGIVLDLSDHGARLVRLYTPDRNGNLADITVGFNDVSGYEEYDRNFNATIGRFANRIAAGKFTLDGVDYQLPLNWSSASGKRCCLHAGTNAMNFVVWDARPVRAPRRVGVEFSHTSEDGDNGFPGKMTVKVTHWLTADNVWAIEYEASVEGKACPVNLTSHAYFNLKGAGNGDINDHELQIFASKYTPVDDGLIPTGELADVKGTPFDFTSPHLIGERVGADHPQLKLGGGYDHNWVLDSQDGSLAKAVVLSEKTTGRFVEVWTTEPGLQFYGGNFMSKEKPVPGKDGRILPWRGALALETQHYPDSPNHANFPNTVLKPGETFKSRTEYRFGVLSGK